MKESRSQPGSGTHPGELAAAEPTQVLDSRALRNALGAFATGVTIVSTRNAQGQDVGITANSFNSVSLDPPMVLWSLSRKSLSLPSFQQSPCFAVHVLAADQDDLSRLFATQGASKFQGIAVERGFGNVPLIDGCAAVFQCRMAFSYDAGDHIIFVGDVLAFAAFERPPLLFHAGNYALAVERKVPPTAVQLSAEAASDHSHDFLFGLLGRAHNQIYRGIQSELGLDTLSAEHLSVLSLLGKSSQGTAGDLPAEATDSRNHAASRLVDAVRSVEKLSGCNLQPDELRLLKQLLLKLLGDE